MDPEPQTHKAKAVDRPADPDPPRLVVLLGVWLLVGPMTLLLLFGLGLTLSNLVFPGHVYRFADGSSLTPESDGGFMELLKIILMIGLLCLYVAILWKVTRRHLRYRFHRPGYCIECGYDLRASAWTCPECGTPILVDKKAGAI